MRDGLLGRSGGWGLVQSFLMVCGPACLSACASLPDDRLIESTPTRPVAIETAQGPVSAARNDAILDQLQKPAAGIDILEQHLAFEQAINRGSPLVTGNKLSLLQNGPDTYEAMFAAMRAARDHINLETFIFEDDEVGQKFADLLLQRQKAGVRVNLIYDGFGTLATPPAFFDRLREGGVHLLEFNPIKTLSKKAKPWRVNNRDHRKLLVIDGHIAFVGGINISDTYASSPSASGRKKSVDKNADEKAGWRDTHIRIEGPVVAEFQKLFLDTWTRQQGQPPDAGHYFPKLDAQGSEIVRAIASTAADKESAIYLTLLSAISHSQQQVHLTIAYFAPDEQLLKALIEAAQRGVDVRLILPSRTDSWAIFNVGRSQYTQLLRGGVKIYERRGAIMHSKTACIDGVWSTIGSSNLDWRSFLHNEEVNAVILSRDFATQMETMFAEDLKQSDSIQLKQWQGRSVWTRVQEWTARLGAYWL